MNKYQLALEHLKKYLPNHYGSNIYAQNEKARNDYSISTLQELINKAVKNGLL